MRNRLSISFAAVVGLLLLSVPMIAHHGGAAFDTAKKITMKGTVVEWLWANPHCILKFDVTNDKGEVEHWLGEASNPPDLINSGWTKQSLKPGDQVSVTVMPVKNGRPIGRIEEVVLPNGQKVGSGFAPLLPPAGAQGGTPTGSRGETKSESYPKP
jgi:Family of unknown function (DUF6152)